MSICFTCDKLIRPSDSDSCVNGYQCRAMDGAPIDPRPMDKCASWCRKVSDPENSCGDCAEEATCSAIRMAGDQCHAFKPKGEVPKRHFHYWHRASGLYMGTHGFPEAEAPPSNRYYDYKEYEPPKRPDPDGWYVVRNPYAGAEFCCRKDGDMVIHLDGQVSGQKWSDYEVLASIPEIKWVDKRDANSSSQESS